MAVSGRATHEQRAFFENAATQLIDVHGAKAVVLGGTDLFSAFDKPDYPYRVVDCGQGHAEAIARVGLG
jgi:aspartate racemase